MKCSSLLLYFVVVFTTNNPLRYLISSTQSSTQRTELGNATVFSFRRSTPSTVNEVHKVLSSTNDDESGNSEESRQGSEENSEGRQSNEENEIEEEDTGDSDVSDEINPEDFEDLTQLSLNSDNNRRPPEAVSIIFNSFNNRKTFTCPKIKDDFVTGMDAGDITPEDIAIISAMGDSLATGTGLWPQTDIEFRGAAFPIGGDATIDGLVTIPNILHEFNANLVGVSHGMGTRNQLPFHQLNVAERGASSSDMPEQAEELVKRLIALREVNVHQSWTMVIIAVGTEEVCKKCEPPDYDALLKALLLLYHGISKVFVVLLGPVHVSSSYHRKANLLKTRCSCSKEMSDEFMQELSGKWGSAFKELQEHFYEKITKRKTFGLLALPMLTITSRYPYSLFIPNRPLLNRKGHMYATKWLWNRLMTGPTYNLSLAVLSEDAYYCPSMGCPYFRTLDNRHYCRLLRYVDVTEPPVSNTTNEDENNRRRSVRRLYFTAVVIVCIALSSVLVVGTILYQRSKMGTRKRFGSEGIGSNGKIHFSDAETLIDSRKENSAADGKADFETGSMN